MSHSVSFDESADPVLSNPEAKVPHTSGSWLRVLGGMFFVSLIWMVFLPWLGEREGIRRHIELMQQSGIDPSAMYYSELESIQETEGTLRHLERDDPMLFWRPFGVEADRGPNH